MPSKDRDYQTREARIGGYSPEWSKRSRDDVPQTDKPPRPNSVVNDIMTSGNSSNGQVGSQKPSTPAGTPSESES